MKTKNLFLLLLPLLVNCEPDASELVLKTNILRDKVKGAWAAQLIGVMYGASAVWDDENPPLYDTIGLPWTDSTLSDNVNKRPDLLDDLYLDLLFATVLEEQGLDASDTAFTQAYAQADFGLWHAHQQGHYNVLNGLLPPASGHWMHNPHANDSDFQMAADFAGIMNPGMPMGAVKICDRVGRIMSSGDGYYGGVFIAALYSYAYAPDSIAGIIEKAISIIPTKSHFRQCIRDVMAWYKQYPDDWKRTRQLLVEKWGPMIGCPAGESSNFHIDAKLNAAHVVIGLLYGEEQFGKTLEIATRCGPNLGCNPATAAGVLGTIMGYEAIPGKWKNSLLQIETMDVKHPTVSLREVYELSYRHALEMIRRNGGVVKKNRVWIPLEDPAVLALEQNFPDYIIRENRPVDVRVIAEGKLSWNGHFEGVGVVLRGKAGNLYFQKKEALLSKEETLNDHKIKLGFQIDGQPAKTMTLPLDFMERSHELFFQYELPPGPHVLEMNVLDIADSAFIDITSMLVYEKKLPATKN